MFKAMIALALLLSACAAESSGWAGRSLGSQAALNGVGWAGTVLGNAAE